MRKKARVALQLVAAGSPVPYFLWSPGRARLAPWSSRIDNKWRYFQSIDMGEVKRYEDWSQCLNWSVIICVGQGKLIEL